MEIISAPSPAQAREALAGIEADQQAVRDAPWPVWLYPVNAAILAALALTGLLQSHRNAAIIAVGLMSVVVNLGAGYRMGTPFALPTSRLFRAGVAGSALCAVVAMILGRAFEPTSPVTLSIVLLAAGAAVVYLLGCVAHHRSTHHARIAVPQTFPESGQRR